MPDSWTDQVVGIGVLAEPARRELYGFVVGQPDAVSREQAASASGLPLHSVKFHLDKLVDEGLLDVEFRRLSGKQGPGAGRPSKLYRRSSRNLAVSLPPRRYDLAGHVLAGAVDRAAHHDVPVTEAVRDVAHEEGRRIAAEVGGAANTDELTRAANMLAEHGYEPRIEEHGMSLANCPFDQLAAHHTELVCGMNLALIDGVVDGLGCQHLEAQLDPQEGLCCVKLRTRG